jgi:hypothetical protein
LNNHFTPYEGKSQHEVEQSELNYLTKKTEVYRNLLSKLIQCAFDISKSPKGPTDEHLNLLYEGLQASWSNVSFWHSGVHLCNLSHHYPKAGQVLIEAARHQKSGIRFNAVMALLYRPAQNVIDTVIEMCVADKSARVRDKVTDACGRLQDKTKIALLQKQLQIETNEKVKEGLNFAIYWLQHDYKLEPGYHKGTYNLKVRTETSYTGITISQEEMDKYGIDKIVQWVKDDKWYSGPIL